MSAPPPCIVSADGKRITNEYDIANLCDADRRRGEVLPPRNVYHLFPSVPEARAFAALARDSARAPRARGGDGDR